ncbi:MAG: hypothetical protein RR053_04210 [Evtepia sp.]
MNLKNNHITIRELMENPKSREVLRRRFPLIINLPIVASSGSLTLECAMGMAAAYVPKNALEDTVRELENL